MASSVARMAEEKAVACVAEVSGVIVLALPLPRREN